MEETDTDNVYHVTSGQRERDNDDVRVVNSFDSHKSSSPATVGGMEHNVDKKTGVVSIRTPATRTTVRVQLVETRDGSERSALVNPERVTKCEDPMDLVELARQVQKSEEFVRARAVGRLGIIAEQMRHLQQQARRVLEEAQLDDALHHAACNFKKIPGHIYHLFEKPSGQKYWSMISPEEWGGKCANKYLGTFRLEADQSWTAEAKFKERSKEIDLMDQILHAQKTFSSAALEFDETPTTSFKVTEVDMATSPPA
uniref:Uncharacterized protein n=1 Tax=Plectus sambesii TaxID=2011161 RepID=A0A914WRX5_9BILA